MHSTVSGVDFFHGDATLTADFDPPAGAANTGGTITGEIHNIVSGGRPVSDNIELALSDPGAEDLAPNITAAGAFTGRALMGNTGVKDDSQEDIYRMTGTWAGNFYNPVPEDSDTTVLEAQTAPGSAAGTFSVSRNDDADTAMVDETESYVGAFGAHCAGDNCGKY